MTAIAICGFEFYVDDPIWDHHTQFYKQLMEFGSTILGGEEFVIGPTIRDTAAYVAGIPFSVAQPGESVEVERYGATRKRLLKALDDADIVLPMSYGPSLYIFSSGGSVDE